MKFDAGKQLPPTIIAASPLMQALFRDVSLVAASETRVLVTGESGAGKEVVADMIHAWSPRVNGPLVKVNCAAIPEKSSRIGIVRPRKRLVHQSTSRSASDDSKMPKAARFFWTRLAR